MAGTTTRGSSTAKQPTPTFDAAASGNTRALLEAQRARLAAAVDDPDTSNRDLSAISRELRAVVLQLDELVKQQGAAGDPIDEVAARRAQRHERAAARKSRAN